MIEKTEKLRSDKFLYWLRGLPCLKCSSSGRNQAAHVRKGTDAGYGQKPSDNYAVPLCSTCHREQHDNGELTFWGGQMGVWKALDCASELFSKYPDTDWGIVVVYKWKRRIFKNA